MIKFQTGTNYQLWVDGPKPETKGKVSLGIRCGEGFEPKANFVAVILDREMLEKIIDDLVDRLNEME